MTAADIIARQLYRDGWTEHEAGECGGCDASRHESAEHILAVLKAAGFEVVELPADDNGGLDDNGQLYFDDYAIRVDNTGPSNTVGDIYTDFAMGSEFKREITPRQCRSLAAALLAAANATEEAK